ncbi:MAG: 4'-phosphopantetheinyl transferase superfamily protein [Oscillospiraceae bacterium]|nr:4'-phosphopantetheinyl transferase superfamily protein [Oscillospiraceae bacterium]
MNIYISEIKDFLKLDGLELVTDSRRERIKRYLKIESKAKCLTAGLLLRYICGVTNDSMLTTGENGKLYLKNSCLHFNISHSGEYVILATAVSEVGVDIEKVKPYSKSVAKRCFTPIELELLEQTNGSENFYRIWTAKESIMKSTGLGFSMLPPSSFCVLPFEQNPHYVAGRYWFLDWFDYNGSVICRALENLTLTEETRLVKITKNELIE